MWTILDTYGDKALQRPHRGQRDPVSRADDRVGTGKSALQRAYEPYRQGPVLPVATSDLGDKWTATLAQQSDYIMSNIHPFFGGINAKDASSWTYSFWTNHNANFFKKDLSKNVISEIGWPSQGGTDCGTTAVTSCPDAAVAGIQQMNQFMEDWVCQALSNGTQYFWFEAFDEPWKIQFNTANQNWEDHWGLMDVNRNLKDGVKIPDCGGKTV